MCATTSAETMAPAGCARAQAWGSRGRCPGRRNHKRKPPGRMRNPAAHGQIEHLHYAQIVKVVSRAFSRAGPQTGGQPPGFATLPKILETGVGPFRKRACANWTTWAMWAQATAKKTACETTTTKPGDHSPKGFPAPSGISAGKAGQLDPGAEGGVKGLGEHLVQNFTFTLTPSDRLGNREISQVRARL